MKTGWLKLTINDLESLSIAEINQLITELNKSESPLPDKEEFKKQVRELVKQGKLDKRFLEEK
jgi:hypothetical protein